MKMMRQLAYASILLVNVSSVIASEPVCHKCEVIREENKHKVCEYEYYEDYLKATQGSAEKPKEESAPATKAPKKVRTPKQEVNK